MSEEQNKRLLDHYTNLIKGEVKTGNPTRDDLIISDAKRHLADLIDKNPSLADLADLKAEEPIEELNQARKDAGQKPIEKPKSKEKK